MKSSVLLVSILLPLAIAGSMRAHAVPVVYEGVLTSGISVSGSVGGFGYLNEEAAQVDFYRFSAVAGSTLNILGVRLDTALDPAFSLYFGTTSADQSQFLNDTSWSGLVFLAMADDEVPNPGPNGDPLLSNFTAPYTGNYTIAIGGLASDGPGPYQYQLTLTSTSAVPAQVPEPASTLLVFSGLAGLAAAYRQRKRARRSDVSLRR